MFNTKCFYIFVKCRFKLYMKLSDLNSIYLQKAINDSGVYWLFAGLSAATFVFCFFFMKETKGKTNREISAMFGAPQPKRNSASKIGQDNPGIVI